MLLHGPLLVERLAKTEWTITTIKKFSLTLVKLQSACTEYNAVRQRRRGCHNMSANRTGF
jgi:hypothetical protein